MTVYAIEMLVSQPTSLKMGAIFNIYFLFYRSTKTQILSSRAFSSRFISAIELKPEQREKGTSSYGKG